MKRVNRRKFLALLASGAISAVIYRIFDVAKAAVNDKHVVFLPVVTHNPAVVPEYEVRGPIRVKWKALGGPKGILGSPVTSELTTSDKEGRYNHFQGGSIYWSPGTGAHSVTGAILNKWTSLGLETSFLGYPTTDETVSADKTGRYNHFQRGSIYWSPETGAHYINGSIRDKWTSLGSEVSLLGYPTTDELVAPDGKGRYNNFQNGSIYWRTDTGAHEVHEAIFERWRSLKGVNSYLGYPLSDVMDWTNPHTGGTGRIVQFEYGQIAWTPEEGVIEIPEEITESGVMEVGGIETLRIRVDLTLRSNGTFRFSGRGRSTGLFSYDYRARAVVKTPARIAFANQHSGTVYGSDTPGPRNDDWEEHGESSYITRDWKSLRTDMNLELDRDWDRAGLLGIIEDVVEAITVFIIGKVIGGPITALVMLASELSDIIKKPIAGPCELVGVAVASGIALVFGPGAVIPAAVFGVIGKITDEVVKCRTISEGEYDWANEEVFKGTLPPRDRIVLTNMTGLGGRAFVMPNVDGTILMHLGGAFDDPMNYHEPAYPVSGEVFIHELTHVWQIEHSSFIPGFVIDAIATQAEGDSAYEYGSPGQSWSDFNPEQQASIVNEWFAGNERSWGRGKDDTYLQQDYEPRSEENPYFEYILFNIQSGTT